MKDVIGPRVVADHALTEFRRVFFAAYEAEPRAVPLELAQHLVFGAVEYARGLGIAPAPDFRGHDSSSRALDRSSCIGFGNQGMPFFVQGPYDDAEGILRTLEHSDGRDNFQLLVSA